MERNDLENPTTQIGALNPTELHGQAFRNLQLSYVSAMFLESN